MNARNVASFFSGIFFAIFTRIASRVERTHFENSCDEHGMNFPLEEKALFDKHSSLEPNKHSATTVLRQQQQRPYRLECRTKTCNEHNARHELCMSCVRSHEDRHSFHDNINDRRHSTTFWWRQQNARMNDIAVSLHNVCQEADNHKLCLLAIIVHCSWQTERWCQRKAFERQRKTPTTWIFREDIVNVFLLSCERTF